MKTVKVGFIGGALVAIIAVMVVLTVALMIGKGIEEVSGKLIGQVVHVDQGGEGNGKVR